MDDEKTKRINSFLATHNPFDETIPSAQINYLSRIDDAIQARLCEIKSAEAILKAQRITIQGIAEDTHISRKTFYNNNLLKQYVESYITVPPDELTENKEQIKALQKEVSRLEEENRMLHMRDCETEMIRHALETTQRLLGNKQQDYSDLEAKYNNLLHERDHPTKKLTCKTLTPKNGKIASYFRPDLFN